LSLFLEQILLKAEAQDIISLLETYRITDVEKLGQLAQQYKKTTPEPFQTQALVTAFRSRDFNEATYAVIKKSLCLVIPISHWLNYHITVIFCSIIFSEISKDFPLSFSTY
jgi:hypothetical protein